MSTTTESKRGIFALMVAHCAGMMDLVALPVWVGTLVSSYKFDPQFAGGLATLFLIGASFASGFFAPRFPRFNARLLAVVGFGLSALAFGLATQTKAFPVLAVLHLAGGFCAGTGLSFTHGTIGTAANPHRLFGWVGMAIGIFGIVFLGAMPGVIAQLGGPALFWALAAVMAAAFLAGMFFFPRPGKNPAHDTVKDGKKLPPLGAAVWFSIVAVALMCMAQSMTLSFFQSIGEVRGFSVGQISLALLIYGIVTVFPAPLAALLEKKFSAVVVISTLPVFQAVFSMIVTHTENFALYAAAGSMMSFTILFVHTFAFGLMARLDPTGRAVAATPAMLMIGSAIAPFLGGTLVKFIGFHAIGYAAIVLVVLELFLYNQTRRLVARG